MLKNDLILMETLMTNDSLFTAIAQFKKICDDYNVCQEISDNYITPEIANDILDNLVDSGADHEEVLYLLSGIECGNTLDYSSIENDDYYYITNDVIYTCTLPLFTKHVNKLLFDLIELGHL